MITSLGDISEEDNMSQLDGAQGLSLAPDMANRARPAIKGKLNFFTTEEYLKKNLIIGEVVLIRFKQTTLRTPTERKCISSTFQHL